MRELGGEEEAALGIWQRWAWGVVMSFLGRRGGSQGRGGPSRDKSGQQPQPCQGPGRQAGMELLPSAQASFDSLASFSLPTQGLGITAQAWSPPSPPLQPQPSGWKHV